MAGYVIMGALAAFGLLSAGWACLGWLLPSGQGCALVCYGMADEGILSRWKWLQSLGLLRCPLICVTDEQCHEIENCAGEELLFRLEMERNRFHGTGNGDPAGRHQRRDISEL